MHLHFPVFYLSPTPPPRANLNTHQCSPFYTAHDQLTPIPSLLRKEGSAHDLDSHIFKNFSVMEHEIQHNGEKENKGSAKIIFN